MTIIKKTSEEYWDRFRTGDSDAFAFIYNEHIKLLLSYGRKVHNDRQMVADVIQELFANLWTRREFIGPTTSVKFYLFKSLRTSMVKEIKKHQDKTFNFENIDHSAHSYSSHENFVIDQEQTELQYKLLKRAISLLPKREQEILYLKYFSGLGNEEIGELLDIQYQSVKNTSFSAIKKLRKYFSSHELQILALAFSCGSI
ncbi:MAG: sigma-70 family RNA polymerase sigma factor [Reichenbachiella sp.]|uniref:RNA polymerase sigma factor n=1 Tax=Reichenbachiella sp. TaxID=2184521 RepID=UPI003266F4A3